MAKALTAIAIKNLKPGPNRREFPVGSGLYLVMQPSGAKTWAFRYRFAGKPSKLTMGPVLTLRDGEPEPAESPAIGDAMTLAQARRLIGDLQHQLVRKQDPAAPARAKKVGAVVDRDDFETFARRYLQRQVKPNTRPSTYSEAVRLLGFVFDPEGKLIVRDADDSSPAKAWAGRTIQEITKRDVIDLMEKITDKRGDYPANSTHARVRSLFNWAVEKDVIGTSPVAQVKRPHKPKPGERTLEDHELRLVWLAAGEIGWPFGHLVKLLILTGCRRDEWAQARWSEIKLDRKVLALPGARTKNGRPHTVHLAAPALTVIDGLKAHRLEGQPDWLFSTGYGRKSQDDKPQLVPISGFSRAKERLDKAMLEFARREAREAGDDPAQVQPIPDWNLHDLRRTFSTGLARLKVPLEVAEKAINHVSGSLGGVAGVYNRHEYEDERRDATARWAAGVERIIAGESLEPPKVVPIKRRSRGSL